MNTPLAKPAAIIVLTFLAVSRANQVDKPEDKTKLVTRVYRLRASQFFRGEPAGGSNENPPFRFKKLPPTADGEIRYDMWEFLAGFGFEKTPGAEAILLEASNALVVTGSRETQEWIEDLLKPDLVGEEHSVEITASLWEYEDEWFPDPGKGLQLFANIRKRAGDSLRPLDSHLIVTKSGFRAVSVNKEAGAARAPVAAPNSKDEKAAGTEAEGWIRLNGARGSFLESEPVIRPDGNLVDFQFGYCARLKRAGEARDLEIEVTTNVTVAGDQDSIPYCVLVNDDPRPVPAGKVRRRALVVAVRVIREQDLARKEDPKQREKEDEQLIRKARERLGVPGK